jgi:hypothetical protein
VRQRVPAASAVVVADSKAASAGEEVAAEALVETEAAAADSVVAEVEEASAADVEEEEEDLAAAAVASDTSLTVSVLPTVLPPDLEDHERADLAAAAVAASAVIADQGAPLGMAVMIDEAAAVEEATTEAQAAQTTSLLAAETDPNDQTAHAMGAGRVGMDATTHGSVDTRATATTIRDNEGGTELFRWLTCASARVCQGYLPFFRLIISRQ